MISCYWVDCNSVRKYMLYFFLVSQLVKQIICHNGVWNPEAPWLYATEQTHQDRYNSLKTRLLGRIYLRPQTYIDKIVMLHFQS
jgi:hypothetical protein